MPLPFASYEIWRVVSGNSAVVDTKIGSHVGFACFAIDLQRAVSGGAGEHFMAAAAGKVVRLIDDSDAGGNVIETEPEEGPPPHIYYEHHLKGSSQVVMGQTMAPGQHLADVGEPKRHLHLAMHNKLGQGRVSVPFAFEQFDVCTPTATNPNECISWIHVKHGLPLNNQWVKWG